MTNRFSIRRIATVAALALVLTGCDDLLTVVNPGPINDDALNSPKAMPALVNGMSGDLSLAVAQISVWSVLWGDDLRHSGTLGAPSIFRRGIIAPEDVGPAWDDMHRARWVAESGIDRMQEVLGDDFGTTTLSARAYLYAGFANRILGENVCQAVFDGGPAQPFTDHFVRAEEQFTEALTISRDIGESRLELAALAGRASVRAALGQWSDAVADAALVPVDFRFDAIFSTNSGREDHAWRAVTLVRGEYTVYGSQWEDSRDPRTPSDTVFTADGDIDRGADGLTPWLRQQKYLSQADNIALAKGTEMLLLRAEAMLRNGDVPAALSLINQGRDVWDLAPVTAATEAEAWPVLHRERGAVLWLEGRRFWDLRRWFTETGPAYHGWLEGRDTCVPISRAEQFSNPNL